MTDLTPAEVFPVGVLVREELAARGWSDDDLCRRTAVPAARVREILNDSGARLLMREAEQLGYALGVSPALLLTIQLAYLKYRNKREQG